MAFSQPRLQTAIPAGKSVTPAIPTQHMVHAGVYCLSGSRDGTHLAIELSIDGETWARADGTVALFGPGTLWTTTFGGLHLGRYFRFVSCDSGGVAVNESAGLDLDIMLADVQSTP